MYMRLSLLAVAASTLSICSTAFGKWLLKSNFVANAPQRNIVDILPTFVYSQIFSIHYLWKRLSKPYTTFKQQHPGNHLFILFYFAVTYLGHFWKTSLQHSRCTTHVPSSQPSSFIIACIRSFQLVLQLERKHVCFCWWCTRQWR